MTCWDSLEHIPEPEKLLDHVGEWLFVSMPVYKDQADCLKSKHFKPGEHLHYWSVRGLIGWFAKMNFGCASRSTSANPISGARGSPALRSEIPWLMALSSASPVWIPCLASWTPLLMT
ncbi:hypothetical protein ACPA9J_15915 [Pseudomonas aeruginosa]